MKMLFNQKGSSLVQVMVISGMVSVFGLAVMQTSKNMQSMKQTLNVKESIEQFKESASNMLMNETACSQTLSTIIASRSAASSAATVPSLKDFSGTIAYNTYNPSSPAATTYHGNIRIESMRFTDFNQATDSANIEVVLLKTNMGAGEKFGQFVLGAKTQTIDIPIRIYFDVPIGGTPNAADTFLSCHSDNGAFDPAIETPLKALCDDDLGGSYYNGKCLVTEHIIDKTRCGGSYGTCSGVPSNPESETSICHNMGGIFDPATKKCKPRFSGVSCAPGTKLKGFDSDGNVICQVP